MTEEVKVTQADKLCAQAIRESVSAATSDMIAARHRIAAQAELLEALEWIFPLLERVDADNIPITQADLPFGKLYAANVAIAKAKGEA